MTSKEVTSITTISLREDTPASIYIAAHMLAGLTKVFRMDNATLELAELRKILDMLETTAGDLETVIGEYEKSQYEKGE